jgi:hypothetical protein
VEVWDQPTLHRVKVAVVGGEVAEARGRQTAGRGAQGEAAVDLVRLILIDVMFNSRCALAVRCCVDFFYKERTNPFQIRKRLLRRD